MKQGGWAIQNKTMKVQPRLWLPESLVKQNRFVNIAEKYISQKIVGRNFLRRSQVPDYQQLHRHRMRTQTGQTTHIHPTASLSSHKHIIKTTIHGILDSGATQHMCNDKTQFTKLEQYATNITPANNTNMKACGKGDIQLVTRNGTAFTLVNVLYVPQLASNLLSVCCAMTNPHMRFNFVHGECRIMFKDTLLATAIQHESLLVLETIGPSAHLTKSIDSLTWHKRLGHLNKDFMSKTSIEAATGNLSTFSCDTCLKNKSTRIISRGPGRKAKRPLEKNPFWSSRSENTCITRRQ